MGYITIVESPWAPSRWNPGKYLRLFASRARSQKLHLNPRSALQVGAVLLLDGARRFELPHQELSAAAAAHLKGDTVF